MYKYLFIIYVAVTKEVGLFIILPVDKGMHTLEHSHLLVCDTM
jgi:glycopeptide antibiotics resistance protein